MRTGRPGARRLRKRPTGRTVAAVRLENIVWDARDPHRLGGFWTAALGAVRMTDEPDLVESRVHPGEGAFLDLCFPRVAEPSTAADRIHPDLAGSARRLVGLGAEPADIGQCAVPWTVLADPEGKTFCVREDRGTGRIAALPLDSADPDRAWGATPLGTPPDLPWVSFTDPSGNEFCVLAPQR